LVTRGERDDGEIRVRGNDILDRTRKGDERERQKYKEKKERNRSIDKNRWRQ